MGRRRQQHQQRQKLPHVLIEIVSATLEPQNKNLNCNTFCLLRDVSDDGTTTSTSSIGSSSNHHNHRPKLKVIHQTQTIKQCNDPIWTVNDRSLYLLPPKRLFRMKKNNVDSDYIDTNTGIDSSSSLRSNNNNNNNVTTDDGYIEFQLFHNPKANKSIKPLSPTTSTKSSNTMMYNLQQSSDPLSTISSSSLYYIGSIELSKELLLQGDGSRQEFILKRNPLFVHSLECQKKKQRSPRHRSFTAQSLNTLFLHSAVYRTSASSTCLNENDLEESIRTFMSENSNSSTPFSYDDDSTFNYPKATMEEIFDNNNNDDDSIQGKLVLRYRIAKEHEIEFMNEMKEYHKASSKNPTAVDVIESHTVHHDHNHPHKPKNPFTNIFFGNDTVSSSSSSSSSHNEYDLYLDDNNDDDSDDDNDDDDDDSIPNPDDNENDKQEFDIPIQRKRLDKQKNTNLWYTNRWKKSHHADLSFKREFTSHQIFIQRFLGKSQSMDEDFYDNDDGEDEFKKQNENVEEMNDCHSKDQGLKHQIEQNEQNDHNPTMNSNVKRTKSILKKKRNYRGNLVNKRVFFNELGEPIEQKLTRIKPYPDPSNKKGTTFLYPQDIDNETYKPSKNWIEAGKGDLGIVYLEVLKCDGLPNLDSGHFGDYTDAFIAMIFEDNLVRTDVIEDELSPRWLPWTQRAFAFQMKHPASPIFLGVFDKDSYGDHDPVGRIVINVSNFRDETVYLLNYKLHQDPNKKDNRGMITVRLRVEWKNKNVKVKRALEKPPRKIFLNVSSLKSFRLVKYLCRGQVDMEKASVESVKQYKDELLLHIDDLFFLADDFLGVLLWRGRIQVRIPKLSSMLWGETRKCKKRKNTRHESHPKSTEESDSLEGDSEYIHLSLWFPIRSMVLFQIVIIMIERPRCIPGLTFFLIGWILFRFMVKRNLHPIPWQRCKSVKDIANDLFIGKHGQTIIIEEGDGVKEAKVKEELDQARTERAKKLIGAINGFLTKSTSDCFSKTNMYAYLTATEESRWTLKSIIVDHYFHTMIVFAHSLLKGICQFFRSIRSVFTWESSYYSCLIMMICFSVGIFLILFPYEVLLLWMFRILAWVCLGPWVKIFDTLYLMEYYPPPDKDTNKLIVPDLDFDPIFESPKYKKLARTVREAKEKGIKLKGMREYRFGEYSEEIPMYDKSLYPCIPLPTSTARPYNRCNSSDFEDHKYKYLSKNEVKWQKFSGQQLHGTMIPHPSTDI